jgi:hypothetical protein
MVQITPKIPLFALIGLARAIPQVMPAIVTELCTITVSYYSEPLETESTPPLAARQVEVFTSGAAAATAPETTPAPFPFGLFARASSGS